MDKSRGHTGKRSHYLSGDSNRKRKRQNNMSEHNVAPPKPTDTVYRILCPGKKIGAVLGKGGTIINALRDETHAKIRVADSFPGVDERVIIIFSSPMNKDKKDSIVINEENENNNEKNEHVMDIQCPAQDALLRVHERIIAEKDSHGSPLKETNEQENVVVRLLVPSIQVGCLLGKGGNIIQKLRSDTCANIRILTTTFLPHGDMSTDELVQISGPSAVVKKALYEVSTLLHRNPRKENPPLTDKSIPRSHDRYDHMRSHWHPGARAPWFGGLGHAMGSPGFDPGGFNHGPPVAETPEEFSLKIVCPSEKIGGVIGKGGSHVKQLERETRASIQVEDLELEASDRVVVVSSTEALRDPRSPTIDALLQIHNKVSDISEKGIVTTRLLVPSSKVGCLLGEGGHIITEMRRRTGADIRVYSKNDKPKYASPNEELVQMSGSIAVVQDALLEIVSRVRERVLRGGHTAPKPPYVGPVPRFAASDRLTGRGPPPSGMTEHRTFHDYDHSRGGSHDGGGQIYPAWPTPPGYSSTSSSVEVRIPDVAVSSMAGFSGSNVSSAQVPTDSMRLQEPQLGSSEYMARTYVSSEQAYTGQGLYPPFVDPGAARPPAPASLPPTLLPQ